MNANTDGNININTPIRDKLASPELDELTDSDVNVSASKSKSLNERGVSNSPSQDKEDDNKLEGDNKVQDDSKGEDNDTNQIHEASSNENANEVDSEPSDEPIENTALTLYNDNTQFVGWSQEGITWYLNHKQNIQEAITYLKKQADDVKNYLYRKVCEYSCH